jgi:uncharacterized membrane protein
MLSAARNLTYINNTGGQVGIEWLTRTTGYCIGGMTIYTTIDYPSASDTTAAGINDAGQICGYYGLNFADHGFLLSGNQFTTLDFGNRGTQALGINDLGQIVGSYGRITGGSISYPHPRMNVMLTRREAQDIAAYINTLVK